MKSQPLNVIFFGWPAHDEGPGADLAHVLVLLHRHVNLTVVPNNRQQLGQRQWTDWLDGLNIQYCRSDQLPNGLTGYGIAFSNPDFFSHRICHRARELGLKVIWSNGRLAHPEGESDAIRAGLVDKMLYVSEVQKTAQTREYGSVPSAFTGNYIAPSLFPFQERRNAHFTIGRLSGPAPEMYPEDFPVLYECLDLPAGRFRVMAWDERVAEKYKWHRFDHRWSLLPVGQETPADFLHSLDLFVGPPGQFQGKSGDRSTIEAMLTGCIPLVPPGSHTGSLVVSGETGFICHDFQEYRQHAHQLFYDYELRCRMARQGRDHAVNRLCRTEEHRRVWLEEVFA